MPPDGDDAPIPVIVLTGFLGSGKTTLLRHILHHPAFSDSAVLINEFGEVGLDHLLVGALDQEPVLLGSGCICCTIRGDLSRAIRDLHARRQRGEIPRFRRLIVETTGLADPAPILLTILSDIMIRHHFRIGLVVATVDAVHAEAGFDTHPQMLRQISMSDRMVVTKTDLADPAAILTLHRRLSRLNPQATLTEAVQGALDPDLLLTDDRPGLPARAGRWLAESVPAEGANDGNMGDADADEGSHGAVRSFCLTMDEPVPWSAFGFWFSLLVHRHGSRLLRVKGLLNIIGSETPVAIHAVQHVIHAPEHLPGWPSGDRQSRIVFIVEGLEADIVRRSFRSFMQLAHRLLPTPS